MADAVSIPDNRREGAQRAFPRKNLFLTATLLVGAAGRAVRIRNLSASGALVEGTGLPASGGEAVLQRGSLHTECTIVWQAGGRAGLHFAHPVDLADWIPGGSGEGQIKVDQAIAEVRAGGGSSSVPVQETAGSATIEAGLLRRTADELAFVSRRLEALGSDLTNDVHVVMRHANSLQELDISMQILGHIARLLVADHPEEVVNTIGMTDLRRRLQRSSPI